MYKSAAIAVVLVAFAFSVSQAATVAYWTFDEKTPGQQATGTAGEIVDSSGNGHHGAAVGNPLPSYASGRYVDQTASIALTSGGTVEDYVEVPNSADFNLMLGDLQDYTIEAYVKSDVSPNATNAPAIFTKRNATGMGYSFRTELGTGNLAFYAEGNGLNFIHPGVFGNTNVLDGNWHHVAVVIDANADAAQTSATFYVDHVLDGTMTFQGHVYNDGTWVNENLVNDATVKIGTFALRPGEDEWVGPIDAVRFSTGALTPSQFLPLGIPEPATGTLMFACAFGLAAYAWRKRK